MKLLALIAVLLLEQVKPFADRHVLGRQLDGYARFFEDRLNDGQRRHGTLAWLIAVLIPVGLTAAIQVELRSVSVILAWLWGVAVLYLTMGFRQFSHHFTEIHVALRGGDLDQARHLLAQWRGRPADELGPTDIAKVAIEDAVVASHRHVFAVVLWFAVCGPCGAILYRLTDYFRRHWGGRADIGEFGDFARKAFDIVEWVPVRVTAVAFGIVGDFQDAIDCWQTQAARWPDAAEGILLSSFAGALGVRLGMPIVEYGELSLRPELGLGDEADVDFMQSGIGLVWRTLVLFLVLLALLAIASWVGG